MATVNGETVASVRVGIVAWCKLMKLLICSAHGICIDSSSAVHVCMYVCMCMCAYVHTHAHMHVCMCACMNICKFVCACMHVCFLFCFITIMVVKRSL